MNGLEAIKAMQEGKIVTTGTNIFKIEEGNVLSSYVGSCAELNDGVYRVVCGFDFSLVYEEYQPKLTGWEGDYGERYFYVNSECFIFGTWDNDAPGDKRGTMMRREINAHTIRQITFQRLKKQRKSILNKRYSVKYNALVIRTVEVKSIGPTRANDNILSRLITIKVNL